MDDSEVSLRDDMTLDYVIRVDDVPPTGRDAAFELPEEMRAAMTQRFGVRNLDALKVDARLVPLDKECLHEPLLKKLAHLDTKLTQLPLSCHNQKVPY